MKTLKQTKIKIKLMIQYIIYIVQTKTILLYLNNNKKII